MSGWDRSRQNALHYNTYGTDSRSYASDFPSFPQHTAQRGTALAYGQIDLTTEPAIHPTELSAFPLDVLFATPSELQGYSPPAISERYGNRSQVDWSPVRSFARDRRSLLDQSTAFNQTIDHRSRDEGLSLHDPTHSGPHVRFHADAIEGRGSSLRLPSTTRVTQGPKHYYAQPGSSRFAPAIAASPPVYPGAQPHNHRPLAPGQSDIPLASGRHRFAPLTRPREPTTAVNNGLSPAEPRNLAAPTPRLPPGFPSTHLSGSGSTASFNVAVPVEQVEAHATPATVAVEGDSIDLTIEEHSPNPTQPQSPTGSSDMQRRRGQPITPSDPSARLNHGARGAGWNNGFDDDESAQTSAARKGKGRAFDMPLSTRDRRGDFSASTQKEVFAGLKIPRVAHSMIASSSFHGQAAGTTDPALEHNTSNAVAGPSSSRLRHIRQDDPLTDREMQGQIRKKEIARQQRGVAGSRKAAAANGKGRTGRNAQKGRAPTEVIEIDSSAEEQEADDIEDADGAASSSEQDGSGLNARASATKPVGHKSAGPPVRRQSFASDHETPSSDDPLALQPAGRADRDRARRVSQTADSGLVRRRISDIERMAAPRPSLASGLKPKTKPRVNGEPTDNGEWDIAPAMTKRIPRAAQASIANGKRNGSHSSLLHDVATVEVDAFVVSRKAVPPDYVTTKFSLIVSTRGDPRTHKITVRRSSSGQGADDLDCEITEKVVTGVHYHTILDEDTVPYIEFRFPSSKQKAVEAFGELARVCEANVTDEEKTVIFPLRDAPTAAWKVSPTTGVDVLFKLCAETWKGTQDARGKAGTVKSIFEMCKAEADRIAAGLDKRASEQKVKNKKGAPEPGQSRLNFSPVQAKDLRLRADSANDLIEVGEHPRRSSRASTSVFASTAQHDAARREDLSGPRSPSPYQPEEVVLEYPMNEAGAVSVTWADTKRLRDEEFLNDTLIEFGLKRIMKDIEERDLSLPDAERLAPQIHVFNSFFYKQLSSKKTKNLDPYTLVEKWTKRVDIFKKKYIVVPVNEYLHWYLAIIVNPAAILAPPPPAPPPAPPRKSNRKRAGTTDGDSVSGSRNTSPEIVSKHFGPAASSRREDATEEMLAEQEDEQAEQEVQEKIRRDYQANEDRKSQQQQRQQAAEEGEAVERLRAQRARSSQSPAPHDAMLIDGAERSPPPASAPSAAEHPQRAVARPNGADDGDEDMHVAPSVSPRTSAQPDIRMCAAEDASEEDPDVRRIRPEVEGGGPGKPDRRVVESPQSQGSHTRFPANAAEKDEDIVFKTRENVADSDDSEELLSPDKIGKPGLRLRRGSRRSDVASAGHAGATDSITLDDEDESLPKPADAAPSSVPIQKVPSSASTLTSVSSSSSSTEAATAGVTAPGSGGEPLARSARPPTTYGSSSASTSHARKVVVSGSGTAFAPMDPEPGRKEELARQREEEEAMRRARVESEGVEMQPSKKGASLDDCWVLTFDSLGGAHVRVTNVLKEYLGREAEAKLGLKETSWKQAQHAKVEVPQQPNTCDCGLYLLHFVETFFKNPQLYLSTVVSTSNKVEQSRAEKAKAKKEVEARAFDLWAGDLAQKKRAAMRADVDRLCKAWKDAIGPLREKQRLEREERKRLRAIEKEAQRDREAAERAAANETLEDNARGDDDQPKPDSAEPGEAPSAAQQPAPPSTPPPPPPPTKSKGRRRPGSTNHEDAEMLELSDDLSSTSGSPLKPPTAIAPTTSDPSPRQSRRQQESNMPEAVDLSPRRRRAHHVEPEPVASTPTADMLALDEPFSFGASRATARIHAPDTVAAVAASPELGVLDSQSLPVDRSPARSVSDERPRKKVKRRHGNSASGGGDLSPMPGSIQQDGSNDDEKANETVLDRDDGNQATITNGTESQELRAPTPPAAQALPPPSFTFGPPTRSKTKAGTETETDTMVLDD